MCLKNNFEGKNRVSNGIKKAKSPWGDHNCKLEKYSNFSFSDRREKLDLKVPMMGYRWCVQGASASGYRTLWSDQELDMHVKSFSSCTGPSSLTPKGMTPNSSETFHFQLTRQSSLMNPGAILISLVNVLFDIFVELCQKWCSLIPREKVDKYQGPFPCMKPTA